MLLKFNWISSAISQGFKRCCLSVRKGKNASWNPG